VDGIVSNISFPAKRQRNWQLEPIRSLRNANMQLVVYQYVTCFAFGILNLFQKRLVQSVIALLIALMLCGVPRRQNKTLA
jgi:hypothetical protein